MPSTLARAVSTVLTRWSLIRPAGPFSPRDSMGEVVFDDQIWLLGGFTPGRTNEIWRSPDGVDWSSVPQPPWTPRNLLGAVAFEGRIWVMGGCEGNTFTNDIWSSPDGIRWERVTSSAPWSPRAAFGLVVFKDRLWLIGGFGSMDGAAHHNDVWISSDGVRWSRIADAPFAPRAMHSAIVFDDRIWVIGGGVYNERLPHNTQANFGDVWSSPDGVSWSCATDRAPWGDRRFHSSVVYHRRMWLIGGYAGVHPPLGNRNDVWHSADGANWTLLPHTPWSIRHEPSVVTFRDRIWLIGGFGEVLKNDIWTYGEE